MNSSSLVNSRLNLILYFLSNIENYYKIKNIIKNPPKGVKIFNEIGYKSNLFNLIINNNNIEKEKIKEEKKQKKVFIPIVKSEMDLENEHILNLKKLYLYKNAKNPTSFGQKSLNTIKFFYNSDNEKILNEILVLNNIKLLIKDCFFLSINYNDYQIKIKNMEKKFKENIENQFLLQEQKFLIEQNMKNINNIKNKIKIKEKINNLQLKNNIDFLKKTNFSLTEKKKNNNFNHNFNSNFIFNIFYNNYIYNNNYHNNSINVKSDKNFEKISFCTVNDFSSFFKLNNEIKDEINKLSFNKTINNYKKKIKINQIKKLFLNHEKKNFNYDIPEFDYNKLFSLRNNNNEKIKRKKYGQNAKKKILEVYNDFYVYNKKQIINKKKENRVQYRYKK